MPIPRIPIERQRSALRALMLATLVLSPLPFGSVEAWAVLALELCAAALGILSVIVVIQDPEALSRPARVLLLMAGVVLAVGLLQLLPWTEAWFSTPGTASRREVLRLAFGPDAVPTSYSLEAPATLDAALRFVAYVLVGLAAAVSVRRRAHLVQCLVVLAGAGAAQALYGSAEYLSGHQHIFAYAKTSSLDEASGTFVNRNHFAAYLAMTLPLALGLVLEGRCRLEVPTGWRPRRTLWLTLPGGQLALAGAAAACAVWLGILLSYSRNGLAAALTGVGVVVATRFQLRKASIVLAILLIPTVWLLWQEVRAPGERLIVANPGELASLHGRLPVWREAGKMALDAFPLGTGLGTFGGAFALYRPAALESRWTHAHNDWLQSAVEGGPLVPLVCLLMLIAVSKRLLAPAAPGRDPSPLPGCVAAALLAIALASLADFSLRIPAVAALTAGLAGLACTAVEEEGVARFAPRVGAAA